ncbi:MAG: hypothetical protein ACE5H4_16105 [Candidatus Thorarchaeota archaeon]
MANKKALKVLKSILDDVPRVGEMTTTNLLYRCQQVSWMLDMDRKSKMWIEQELMGYPSQTLGEKVPTGWEESRVPTYRIISLPSQLTSSRQTASDLAEGTYSAHRFSIVFPCQILETAEEPLSLCESTVVEGGRGRGPMVLTFTGEIPAHLLNGISSAIRGRIHLFATQLSLALEVGAALSGFFDNTLSMIADRIGKLAPSTLEILNETVSNLRKSKSPEHLRVILETLRTTMRRITGVLLTSDMLDEEEPPSESAVMTKVTRILGWAKVQLEGKSRNEANHLMKAASRYQQQTKMIMDLINKPIHKSLHSTNRAMVERILVSVIVWIGDMIGILDRAGYIWERESKVVG